MNKQTDSESLVGRDAPIEGQLFLDQPIPERGIGLLAAAGIEGPLGVADGGVDKRVTCGDVSCTPGVTGVAGGSARAVWVASASSSIAMVAPASAC